MDPYSEVPHLGYHHQPGWHKENLAPTFYSEPYLGFPKLHCHQSGDATGYV